MTAGVGFTGRAILAAWALALLISLGAANSAGAARPPTGGDSHQQACRAIYDRSASLRDEYKQVAGASGQRSPRLDEIIAELQNLGRMWRDLKCDSRYGSIAHLVDTSSPWWADRIIDSDLVWEPVTDPVLEQVADSDVGANPQFAATVATDDRDDLGKATAAEAKGKEKHGKHGKGKKGKQGGKQRKR